MSVDLPDSDHEECKDQLVNTMPKGSLFVRSFAPSEIVDSKLEHLAGIIEETREIISRAEKNIKFTLNTSEMMRNLLLDLLDLAQFERGSFTINNEYFDLMQVIKKAFKTLEPLADLKEIAFSVDSGEDDIFFKKLYGDSRRYL